MDVQTQIRGLSLTISFMRSEWTLHNGAAVCRDSIAPGLNGLYIQPLCIDRHVWMINQRAEHGTFIIGIEGWMMKCVEREPSHLPNKLLQ